MSKNKRNDIKYATPEQTIKFVPVGILVNFAIATIGLLISGAAIDLWYLAKLYFMCVGVLMTAIAIWYFVKGRD